MAAIRYPDPTTGQPSDAQDHFRYNRQGELTERKDRNETVVEVGFDPVGRTVSSTARTLGTGVDGAVRRLEFAFDAVGRTTSLTSFDAVVDGEVVNQVKRDYNGLGQLTAEWQSHSKAVAPDTRRTQYAYSHMSGGANHSRITSVTGPSGRSHSFDYSGEVNDRVSRVAAVKEGATVLEEYQYLGAGVVVTADRPGVGVKYTLIGGQLGDSQDPYSGLDRFDRPVEVRWEKTGGGYADRFTYGYDVGGAMTFRDNLVNPAFGEVTVRDAVGRVASFRRGTLNPDKDGVVGAPTRSQDWQYDRADNWDVVTTDGTAQDREYDRRNRLTALPGGTVPTYDAAGNITADEGGQAFKYDAWGRLVQAGLTDYRYDAAGRRITEDRPGSAPRHFYFGPGDEVLEEWTEQPSGLLLKTAYVSSPATGRLILRDRDTGWSGVPEERLWVQWDATGNVTSLADGTGAVLERYVYDAFGRPAVLAGDWTARAASQYEWDRLWGGSRYDPVTGLYHLGGTDYSPTLGQALQSAGSPGVPALPVIQAPPPPGEPVPWFDPNAAVSVRHSTMGLWHWFNNRRNAGRNFVAENIVQDSFVEYLDEQFGEQPGGPNFGESLVPVYGPLRDMCASINNGRWGRAIQSFGWALLDATTIGGAAVVRGAVIKGGTRAALTGVTRAEVRALSRVGAKEAAKKAAGKVPQYTTRGNGLSVFSRRTLQGPAATQADVDLYRIATLLATEHGVDIVWGGTKKLGRGIRNTADNLVIIAGHGSEPGLFRLGRFQVGQRWLTADQLGRFLARRLPDGVTCVKLGGCFLGQRRLFGLLPSYAEIVAKYLGNKRTIWAPKGILIDGEGELIGELVVRMPGRIVLRGNEGWRILLPAGPR